MFRLSGRTQLYITMDASSLQEVVRPQVSCSPALSVTLLRLEVSRRHQQCSCSQSADYMQDTKTHASSQLHRVSSLDALRPHKVTSLLWYYTNGLLLIGHHADSVQNNTAMLVLQRIENNVKASSYSVLWPGRLAAKEPVSISNFHSTHGNQHFNCLLHA